MTTNGHMHEGTPPADEEKLLRLLANLDEAAAMLGEARDFAKPGKLPRVLDTARRVLLHPGGAAALEVRARALEEAGVFLGSDWATPQYLLLPSPPTRSRAPTQTRW